jgi:hypothetical protein
MATQDGKKKIPDKKKGKKKASQTVKAEKKTVSGNTELKKNCAEKNSTAEEKMEKKKNTSSKPVSVNKDVEVPEDTAEDKVVPEAKEKGTDKTTEKTEEKTTEKEKTEPAIVKKDDAEAAVEALIPETDDYAGNTDEFTLPKPEGELSPCGIKEPCYVFSPMEKKIGMIVLGIIIVTSLIVILLVPCAFGADFDTAGSHGGFIGTPAENTVSEGYNTETGKISFSAKGAIGAKLGESVQIRFGSDGPEILWYYSPWKDRNESDNFQKKYELWHGKRVWRVRDGRFYPRVVTSYRAMPRWGMDRTTFHRYGRGPLRR